MNGRVYDPVIGRFLSPDPVVAIASFSQSWNAYSYALNSPLSYTDPSGTVVASGCPPSLCAGSGFGGGGFGPRTVMASSWHFSSPLATLCDVEFGSLLTNTRPTTMLNIQDSSSATHPYPPDILFLGFSSLTAVRGFPTLNQLIYLKLISVCTRPQAYRTQIFSNSRVVESHIVGTHMASVEKPFGHRGMTWHLVPARQGMMPNFLYYCAALHLMPNDYSLEFTSHAKLSSREVPYPLDLLLHVITVSLETMKIAEVVVAGDVPVSLPALGRAAEHGEQPDRAHLIEGARRRFQRRFRVGPEGQPIQHGRT